MGKMHQLLSVIQDLKGQAAKILNETEKVFSAKQNLFDEEAKDFKPLNDEDRISNLMANQLSSHTAMVETVASKLSHFAEHYGPFIDAALQVDMTNTRATTSIDIGLKTFDNVPATFLLQFEKMLREIRKIYDAIPTLDMKVIWAKDPMKGAGVWRAPKEETVKTRKVTEHKVIVQPTDKHPAQVAEYTTDEPVGVYEIHKWSGKITPEQKYRLLRKIDEYIRLVKTALGKANEAEHSTEKISDVFFKELHSVIEG